MTNLQLLLSIGIPTLAVLLAMYQNHKGFGYVEKRFDLLEKRIDDGNKHIVSIEADLRQFYATLGSHGEAIEIVKKKLGL